jgi:hypothetical protein
MTGPQSSFANDKQNQFSGESLDNVQISIFDSTGKPLNKQVLLEVKHHMTEFILNNIQIPDISSLYDFSAQKLKFSPNNFTDLTIRKYINFLEKHFLIKKNPGDTKYLIAFACFQGPVSFFIKKVMANFDFKTPFNVVDTPMNSQTIYSNSFADLGGSEFVMSNGASKNIYCTKFCPRDRLERLIKNAESKNSKLLIQTDPLGSHFILHEAIMCRQTGKYFRWRLVSLEEIVILTLNLLKTKNGVEFLSGKTIMINQKVNLPLLLKFCKNNKIIV